MKCTLSELSPVSFTGDIRKIKIDRKEVAGAASESVWLIQCNTASFANLNKQTW